MPDVEKIVGIGLDRLTVTQVEGSESEVLINTARDVVNKFLPDDVIPSDWGAMGYHGQNYGQVKFGRRKADEAILIISGDLAEKVGITYHIPPERVTRADFQVTVAPSKPDPEVARRLHTSHRALTTTETEGKLWTYISSPSGDTFSLGKRGGNRYLRLYDKSKDMRPSERGTYWRYEVEFKGPVAKAAMSLLNQAPDRYAFVGSQVFQAFEKRGVRPGYGVDTDIAAIEVSQAVVTAESKLNWLSRCVSPVVTQLINLGYEEQVLSSLKLRGIYREGE